MFHILAWRWPFLALFLAVVFWIGRHYTIGGIEHLHLKPRETAVAQAPPTSPLTVPTNTSLFDWDPVSANMPEGFLDLPYSGSKPSNNPTPTPGDLPTDDSQWQGKLSLGEKLSMWQAKTSENPLTSETLAADTDTRDPSSAPIPLPPHFRLSTKGEAGSSSGHIARATVSTGFGPAATQPVATLRSETAAARTDDAPDSSEPMRQTLARTDRIRVGSFNLGSLSPSKLSKPQATMVIVSLLQEFDLVALQGVQSDRDDLLPILVDKLNATGRKYDFLIGPRVGRVNKLQFAMIFDTERLETDRYQLYTVKDPEDLVQYEPLVGWFRCKGVANKEAFTFSLINVMLDRDLASSEQAMLPSLIEAVQRDGRNEDDWIVAGGIGGSVERLNFLDRRSVRFAVRDIPTNLEGTQQFDSIFFSSAATAEYTGRSGATDFLRKLNLSMEQALEVSPFIPVWAEFSTVEGFEPGRVSLN
ncbi:MAG: hypothetical protein VXZ82_06430 [Planctomycetota bacterium]|nr:hypothetical protein [Planctomycetota bacterium]